MIYTAMHTTIHNGVGNYEMGRLHNKVHEAWQDAAKKAWDIASKQIDNHPTKDIPVNRNYKIDIFATIVYKKKLKSKKIKSRSKRFRFKEYTIQKFFNNVYMGNISSINGSTGVLDMSVTLKYPEEDINGK